MSSVLSVLKYIFATSAELYLSGHNNFKILLKMFVSEFSVISPDPTILQRGLHPQSVLY